jgi:hypothetical protein
VEARGEVLEEIMLVGEEAIAGVGMMAAGATEAVHSVVKDEEMAGEAAGADSEEVVAEVAVKAEVVEAAEELTGDPGIKSRLRIRWVYSLQRRVLSSLVKIIESKHRMDALLYDWPVVVPRSVAGSLIFGFSRPILPKRMPSSCTRTENARPLESFSTSPAGLNFPVKRWWHWNNRTPVETAFKLYLVDIAYISPSSAFEIIKQ